MAEAEAERGLDETEREILNYVKSQPGQFVGTAEVADRLDITTNGASYRLKELRKKDRVESRQPSRDEIWYIPAVETGGGINIQMIRSHYRDLGFVSLSIGGWAGWLSIAFLIITAVTSMNNFATWIVATFSIFTGISLFVFSVTTAFTVKNTELLDQYDIMDSFDNPSEKESRE